jgi:hypothetical protein
MATKRRTTDGTIPGLEPAMVDYLLTGSSELDPWIEWFVTEEEVDAAWRLYGPQLRAEAARRGIEVKR